MGVRISVRSHDRTVVVFKSEGEIRGVFGQAWADTHIGSSFGRGNHLPQQEVDIDRIKSTLKIGCEVILIIIDVEKGRDT